MTLDDFLQKNEISNAEFGRKIGTSGEAVGHWRNRRRTPRPAIIEKIKEATNGKVKPNDFYGAAQ